jgi:hypothetical protein
MWIFTRWQCIFPGAQISARLKVDSMMDGAQVETSCGERRKHLFINKIKNTFQIKKQEDHAFLLS